MVIRNGKFVASCIDIPIPRSIQPHGYDLHIGSLFMFKDIGLWTISEECKTVRLSSMLQPVKDHYILGKGDVCTIRFAEKITIPDNCVGITTQRSTLMRNGLVTNVGIWDAGYSGYGTSLLMCHTNARLSRFMGVVQLTVYDAEKSEETYKGIYQHETPAIESVEGTDLSKVIPHIGR